MAEEGRFHVGIPPDVTAEQSLGLDIPRTWANGVQLSLAGDVAFFIFREQINLASESGEPNIRMRNVASIVLPVVTAVQMRDLLNKMLEEGGVEESAA